MYIVEVLVADVPVPCYYLVIDTGTGDEYAAQHPARLFNMCQTFNVINHEHFGALLLSTYIALLLQRERLYVVGQYSSFISPPLSYQKSGLLQC